jgi:putative FmdB family regulatory protein
MPIYVYECGSCAGRFEVLHGMDEEVRTCRLCGAWRDVKRVPAVPGRPNLIGPGFYENDYGKGS